MMIVGLLKLNAASCANTAHRAPSAQLQKKAPSSNTGRQSFSNPKATNGILFANPASGRRRWQVAALAASLSLPVLVCHKLCFPLYFSHILICLFVTGDGPAPGTSGANLSSCRSRSCRAPATFSAQSPAVCARLKVCANARPAAFIAVKRLPSALALLTGEFHPPYMVQLHTPISPSREGEIARAHTRKKNDLLFE